MTTIKNINANSELESYIRKLEYDVKYYIKIYFYFKLKNNSLEQKINAYMEMEEEFEELKTKVKYDEGKFLENDRKENEIMILKRENSNLKNEIIRLEQKNKLYENDFRKNQDIINTLKNEIKQLNNKVLEVNKNNGNDNKSSRNISIRVLNRKNSIKDNMTIRTLYKSKKTGVNSSGYTIFNPKSENRNNILIRCLNINKDNFDKLEKNQSNSITIRDYKDNKSTNKNSNGVKMKLNNERKNSKSFYRLGRSSNSKDKKNYLKKESHKSFCQFSLNIY